MEPLYQTTVVCANCQEPFQTSRVRPSFKKPERTDSDFCTHFKAGNENPEFYVVRVCPGCGFASTESFAKEINDKQRAAFRARIGATWEHQDYGGPRSLKDAMTVYKLALLTAQAIGERPLVIASILHHIAWLYRYQGNWEGEERFLRFALEQYVSTYETEGLDSNGAKLMYLIGDLHRRLKEYADAVKWYGRVINDKRIVDAAMIRACREGWAATREEMTAAQLELPEELQSAKR